MKLTKNEQQLIRDFDQEKTTLVISHWPVKAPYDGVATYTENLVKRFAAKYNHQFVVMVPYEWNGSRIKQINRNILVIGVFEEKKIHLYPQILSWLARFPKSKNVVVHSEFCASSGLHLRAMVVPFLALIKMTGRQITYYAHNIADSISNYSTHLGLSDKTAKSVLDSLYCLYLLLISQFVDKFVVLEQPIARRLQEIVGKNKRIVVTPHWIETKKSVNKTVARKRLGIPNKKKVVVSFGFLSWYKGADLLVEAAKALPNNYLLVLAGGEATSLKGKDYYQIYYRNLLAETTKPSNTKVTGFLSEKEIDLWFAAADLVVMPYRLSMGGSGSLQQALNRHKPVVISTAIEEGIGGRFPLTFKSGSANSLVTAIVRYFSDKQMRRDVLSKGQNLREKRDVKTLLPLHYESVYSGRNGNFVMLEWTGEQNKADFAQAFSK